MKKKQFHKTYKLIIYLFAEGQKTEHQYIYDYIQKTGKSNLVRVIKQGVESDCEKLVKNAINFESKNFFDKSVAPHQTWVVFDHDGNETKVNKALKKIQEYNGNSIPQKQVHYAFMKPCMEIWPLMHFQEKFDENRNSIQRRLNVLMPKYNHANHPIFDLDILSNQGYQKACALAKNWHASLDDKNNPNSGCYYAGIYFLTQEIDKIN